MTPDFKILADDEDVSAIIGDRLLSLTVIDEEGGSADRLEIRLDDRDSAIEFPKTGAILDVSLGFKETGLSYMGRYAVDGISGEGPVLTMTIMATAANMIGSIRAPKTRAWEGVTLKDIVAKIAAESALEPIVAPAIEATHYGFIAQSAESNLHFLTRLGRDLNATVKPAAGKLIMLLKGEGKNAKGEDIKPLDIPVARLTDWRWKLEERATYGSVESEWGDMDGGATQKVVRGDAEPKKKLRHVYASEAEAIRAAEAELGFAGREAFTLNAELAGFEPSAFAGGLVRLPELRNGLGGEWHIKTVTHRLTNALVTSLELKKGKPDA